MKMEGAPGTTGAAAAQPQRFVKFGPVDVSDAFVEAETVSAVNARSTGVFRFDFNHSVDVADYFGELCFTAIYEGKSYPLFTGSVTEATPTAGGVDVKAMAVVQLQENVVADIAVRGVTAPEMIYVLARGSGIREERLNIAGLESLSAETFEVITPIDSVDVDRVAEFAGVEFLPRDHDVIGTLSVADALRTAFQAPAYARASVTATRILEAEEKGLAAIDLALAWLTAQLRCGAAELPRGIPVPFKRDESLAQPRRRKLVSVRGTSSGRHWLRQPDMTAQERVAHMADGTRPLNAVLSDLTLQEKQALLALARAVREPDRLAQVHDLWEAIEFYCSGTSVDPLFTTEQLDVIIRSLPALDAAQHQRAVEVIGQLNSAPLVTRLKQAIQDEGVPVTDGEIDVLRHLRKLRNDVAHGRRSQLPIPEDVEYATSLVARLLIYRIARLSRANPGKA
jgi:hypothetical protein